MTIGGLGGAKAQNEAVKLVVRETGASVNAAKTAIQEQFGNPIEDAAGSIFNFGIPSDLGSVDSIDNDYSDSIDNQENKNKNDGSFLDKLKDFFKKQNEKEDKQVNPNENDTESLDKYQKEKNPGDMNKIPNDDGKKEKNPGGLSELPSEDDSKKEKQREKAASFAMGSFQTLPHTIKPGEENGQGSWHTLPHIIKPGEENKGSWHTLPHKINPEDWGGPLEKMPKTINPDNGKELKPNDIFPKGFNPDDLFPEQIKPSGRNELTPDDLFPEQIKPSGRNELTPDDLFPEQIKPSGREEINPINPDEIIKKYFAA